MRKTPEADASPNPARAVRSRSRCAGARPDGGRHGRNRPPGGAELGLLPCCLCTNMWMTCAQRRWACVQAVEMLGISQHGRNQNRAFTRESASNILCIKKKPEFSTCHTGINDELAERLSQVYTVVINRREGETLTLETVSPGALKGESNATAVNAPGMHQALADGSPTSPQSAASARSEPGPARDAQGLAALLSWLDDQQAGNPVLVARVIAAAALRRCESRGAHTRLDHPGESPALAHSLRCPPLQLTV